MFESLTCGLRTATTTGAPKSDTTNLYELKQIMNDPVRGYLTKKREIVWQQETQKECPLFRVYSFLSKILIF